MNFKKLLPIAFMAFGALVGCGKGGGGGKGGFPSAENEDGVHTVTVTNAADLGEEFRVEDRITLDLALTDDGEEKNPLVELNDGNLEILSSNESIITISGLVIEGAGVGEAKVAIKYYKTVKLFSFNVLEKMTNKIKYGTAHEGDEADPFTNEDALLVGAYIKENNIETTADSFYIKGEVDRFYHAPGSRQDGAVSWFLKPATEGGDQFEVYKCYKDGTGAASYLTDDDVWANGMTVITGKITTYGDQVETPSAKFVSCTGNKPEPKQTYEVTVAQALEVGSALADGASTWDIYAVTGYVVLKDGSNYFLADSKTAATTDLTTLYEIYGVTAAADEAKLLKGAKVKVTAQLKNYHGQVENNGTYTLELLEAGEEWVINYQEVTFAQALAAAKALADGAYSDGYYKTTAKVVKVTYAWSNGTMSLTINESGLEADETMTVYKLACTEAESAKVVVGATVTVGGKLQNYVKNSNHTYEFTSPVLFAAEGGEGGGGEEEGDVATINTAIGQWTVTGGGTASEKATLTSGAFSLTYEIGSATTYISSYSSNTGYAIRVYAHANFKIEWDATVASVESVTFTTNSKHFAVGFAFVGGTIDSSYTAAGATCKVNVTGTSLAIQDAAAQVRIESVKINYTAAA